MRKRLGILLLYKTSNNYALPRGPLVELAKQSGFDEPDKFIPQPRDMRGAFRAVTGAVNYQLIVNEATKQLVYNEYEVKPMARLTCKIISETNPLIRHLVREVSVPYSNGDVVKSAGVQYQPKTVAVLTFDGSQPAGSKLKVAGQGEFGVDPYVDNLGEIITKILNDIKNQITLIDGGQVRVAIRDLILDSGGVLVGGGGAYYLPPDKDKEARSIRSFVRGVKTLLPQYQKTPSKILRQFDAMVSPLAIDPDTDPEALSDIVDAATRQYLAKLQKIADKLKPVKEGGKSATVAGNIIAKATQDRLQLKSMAEALSDALGDELDKINTAIGWLEDDILAAMQAVSPQEV